MESVVVSSVFWGWYAFFVSFVVLQAVAAYFDGYAVPPRAARQFAYRWSFFEHGGMWADILLISPLLAYILTTHTLQWSHISVTLGLLAVLISGLLGYFYLMIGRRLPHLHAHDGRTTVAGWLHNVYTVLALFVVFMFCAKQVTPVPTRHEGIAVAVVLSVFAVLGVAKISPWWRIRGFEAAQVVVEIVLIWAIAYVLFLM